MGNTITKRLDSLERHLEPKGPFVVVRMVHDDWSELTPQERREKLADAERRAGPHGSVLQIEYVKDWRPAI